MVVYWLEGRRYAHISDYIYDYKISICCYSVKEKRQLMFG